MSDNVTDTVKHTYELLDSSQVPSEEGNSHFIWQDWH